jgi:hypothetical protein
MTKDKALDLALEALGLYQAAGFGNSTDFNKQHEAFYKAQTAIIAIKQARALDKKAENARELGLDYEPVQKQRWAVFCSFCNKKWSVSYQHPGKSVCLDCDDAPPAQPAPVQSAERGKPAFYRHEDGHLMTPNRAKFLGLDLDDLQPLYTTPPAAPVQDVSLIDEGKTAAQRQWTGLTDEQKLMCWARATHDADVEHKTEHQCLMDYGTEIEAKLKERNV